MEGVLVVGVGASTPAEHYQGTKVISTLPLPIYSWIVLQHPPYDPKLDIVVKTKNKTVYFISFVYLLPQYPRVHIILP